METLEDVLAHHGIKGMKWGVRRKRGSDGTVEKVGQSEDAAKAASYKKRVHESGGPHSLSNQELQHLVNRIDLEQRYSRITGETGHKAKIAKGKKASKAVLGTAKTAQEVYNLVNGPMGKAIRKALI